MKHLFYSILLLLAISSCISPYDFVLDENPSFLLIDGQIYDQDSCVIRLSYTNQKSNDPTNKVINDAKIQVIENGSKKINFVFEGVGQKYKPENLTFRGCIGCTYQLDIVLPDGKQYISTIDTMKTPDRYEKIFDIYNPETRKFEVYANLRPKSNVSSYYQTYFINYERATYCADCGYSDQFDADLYPYTNPPRRCPGYLKACKPTTYLQQNRIFGFRCEGANPKSYNCWNFKRQRYYFIFADNILALNTNRTLKLLEVPLTDYNRYYIEVYQNHITANNYQYMKALEENGQRTGSLTDPIPPIIAGNVNLKGDENQRALGFFQVSGQVKYGYTVERTKAPTGIGLLPKNLDLEYYDLRNGQLFDTYLEGCNFPAYAECKCTSFRTNVEPLNWRD
jgi:predicted Zn-ribbon and HTH transcriptional regulator